MELDVCMKHGICKACGYESLVLCRRFNEESDAYNPDNVQVCPHCRDTDNFIIKEDFEEYGYTWSETELNDLSDLLGLARCKNCGCSLILSGDNRTILMLTVPYLSQESYLYPNFCKNCYESISEKRLLEICSKYIESRISEDISPDTLLGVVRRRKVYK